MLHFHPRGQTTPLCLHFRDFSELCHLHEVLLGIFQGGELEVHALEALILCLALGRADLSGVVVNVHDRLVDRPNHQLERGHFQGRGLLDLGNDALLGGQGALACLCHANGVDSIAGLVLGVPGLGGGQGQHTGRHSFRFGKL